jgi:hypothetical protein
MVQALGDVAGHRLDILSAEVWETWWDLRFARVAIGGGLPLARRVPGPAAWTVHDDLGTAYEVVDAVGRGDRDFSNGEVRLRPRLASDATSITITVDLGPGTITDTVSW